jgi:NDP-sugar pyrophosphorylase family protein
MRAGIFAAGFGTRLQSDAARPAPKGLLPIAGRPLIDWVLSEIEQAGADDVVVIVNEHSTAIRDHVELGCSIPVRWLVETTPSSMHSFLRVVEELSRDGDQGPFLISTVDTIAPTGTFRRFVDLARESRADLVLALTAFVEDDNPLRIEVAAGSHGPAAITAVGEGRLATAGYYLVRPTVLREAGAGRSRGLPALRHFFKHLFTCGYQLSGVCMPDSVDVDRPSDVASAERVLRASLP